MVVWRISPLRDKVPLAEEQPGAEWNQKLWKAFLFGAIGARQHEGDVCQLRNLEKRAI
jgi:hypothetical protein